MLLENLEKDDWVQENPITNYDSLRVLVKKVNEQLGDLEVPDRIDETVADLRDAIAHGRITALHPEGPYRLLKFSRAKEGMVQVEVAKTLSPSWLREQVTRTKKETEKVQRIGQSLRLSSFPEQ